MASLSHQKPDVHAELPKGQSILQLLHKDHEAVSGLFAAIEAAGDVDERLRLVQQLVRELKLHSGAEEDVFYERLEQEHAARRRMNESRDDHADIDLQLERLARLDGDDDRLLLLVGDLKADVERHVQREESEVFAAAEAFLDLGEQKALGQAFVARKQQLAGDGGAADVDDAELAHAPQMAPASLQSAAELDPGFEDRGVGSDGSSPQAPSTKPAPASSPASTPPPPSAPMPPSSPSKAATQKTKPKSPKPWEQPSKVQQASAHLPYQHGKGFEGQNAGGRHGDKSQRENHLSRDKQTPRVHDGRGRRGPENDR